MGYEKHRDDLLAKVIRQTNKRKKTGRWCRGKVGVEHTPELVVNHNYNPTRVCGWRDIYSWRSGERQLWKWHYSCRHSYRCTKCGKYTEYFLKNVEECPDFAPCPELPQRNVS